MNFKITKVRTAMIELLDKTPVPLSVEEILQKLSIKKLTPNKTTVYREIEFLIKQELLEAVDFGEGKKRYEASGEHHHHIKCINCGIIEDVPEENFKLKIKNFKLISHSLEFFGLCQDCK